jgi:hypothetical protein
MRNRKICISIRWVKDERGEPLDEPRPLNESESGILDAMLGVEFTGVPELRAQLARVQVVGQCHCGCPTVDLGVPPEIPASGVATRGCLAPVVGHLLPIEYGATREIIVHVDDGRLSRLAFVSSDDPGPLEWPPLGQLSVSAMKPTSGPPDECLCPSCRTGVLHVPRDVEGPMYMIEPIPSSFESVCQPKERAGRTLPNCGRRHQTVDGVGWVEVREPSDS